VRQQRQRDGDHRQAVWVKSISRRRSSASATTPPPSAKTMMGTMRKNPSNAQRKRRPAEQVQLPDHRHLLHLRTGQRNGLAGQEQAKSRERRAMKRAAGGRSLLRGTADPSSMEDTAGRTQR